MHHTSSAISAHAALSSAAVLQKHIQRRAPLKREFAVEEASTPAHAGGTQITKTRMIAFITRTAPRKRARKCSALDHTPAATIVMASFVPTPKPAHHASYRCKKSTELDVEGPTKHYTTLCIRHQHHLL